jgi:hypothetical protein
MSDRAGRATAICFVLASWLAVEVHGGSSWRGAGGLEDPIFECDFESGYCELWSAVTTPETCNGLDDNCDTNVDEDTSCSEGLSCCGSGGCVDLMSDPGHCNFCDAPCEIPDNGVPSCEAGACGIESCNAGFDDCDAQAFNGCETNLNTDPDHCSLCGEVCPLPANGVAGCESGLCGIESCDTGFDDCDGQSFNGCEIDSSSDEDHCGGCDTTCAFEEVCTAGVCGAP